MLLPAGRDATAIVVLSNAGNLFPKTTQNFAIPPSEMSRKDFDTMSWALIGSAIVVILFKFISILPPMVSPFYDTFNVFIVSEYIFVKTSCAAVGSKTLLILFPPIVKIPDLVSPVFINFC